MSWEEKLVKHHVEDEKDYNGEKMRHFYIDYHHLLHQCLAISLNHLSPNKWSKNKIKIQNKRRKTSYSTTRREKT